MRAWIVYCLYMHMCVRLYCIGCTCGKDWGLTFTVIPIAPSAGNTFYLVKEGTVKCSQTKQDRQVRTFVYIHVYIYIYINIHTSIYYILYSCLDVHILHDLPPDFSVPHPHVWMYLPPSHGLNHITNHPTTGGAPEARARGLLRGDGPPPRRAPPRRRRGRGGRRGE